MEKEKIFVMLVQMKMNGEKEILLLKKIVILKEKLNIILIHQYRLNNLKRVVINIHYKENL